jgi:hypothetical protein
MKRLLEVVLLAWIGKKLLARGNPSRVSRARARRRG